MALFKVKDASQKQRDPNGSSGLIEGYFDLAGTTYGGLILWRLHAWWRTSKLIDGEGYKWTVVSLRKLSEDLKMDRKTMERHVKKLEEMGLIESRMGNFRNLPQKEIRVLLDVGMEPITKGFDATTEGYPSGGKAPPDHGN